MVVGAGPTGLVAGCELARRGVPVRVIDKLAAPTDESRAIVVHARSLEMFAQMGIVDALIESGVKTRAMQMYSGKKRLVKVPLSNVESAYPFTVTTAQTETERILGERLVQLGGRVERGAELTALEQDGDQVQVTIRRAGGQTERATAAYVVGADGGHSAVRAGVGTQLEGSFKGERFALGDVEADHHLETDSMYTMFSGQGPLLLFPMRGQRMRIIAQVHGSEPGAAPSSPTVADLQALVDERGGDLKITAAHWTTEFEIHHAQVPAYRHGRVFLAGDAAHVHSPAGGQGMNTGMQDAFNLGWKLAAVLNDEGGEALLESYHAERHPVAARVIKLTTMLTNVATIHHELPIKIRNAALHAIAGVHAVTDRMVDETEEVTVAYRKSPVVVAGHRHRLHAGDHLPAQAGVELDPTGHTTLDAAPFGLGDGWIVVRPDGYIGALAADDAGVDAYFAQLRH